MPPGAIFMAAGLNQGSMSYSPFIGDYEEVYENYHSTQFWDKGRKGGEVFLIRKGGGGEQAKAGVEQAGAATYTGCQRRSALLEEYDEENREMTIITK